MLKKLKLKKSVKIILLIILILILFINFFLIDRNYEVEYEVNGYSIRENYNDEEKMYSFLISNGDIKHTFLKKYNYQKKHQLIKNVFLVETAEEQCLLLDAEFEITPLCSNSKEAFDYRMASNEMKEKLNIKSESNEDSSISYNNYKIYNTLDYNLIIWNYKTIININKDINEKKILENDSYNFNLSTMINEYILIPDYNNQYVFNKFYIYNIKENSVEEMKIDYEISFDSYILGTFENSIYLVDKKNKIEYEIVPHKKKIRKVGTNLKKGVTLTSKGLEKISLSKLCSKEVKFYNGNKYEYIIENENLYQSINNVQKKVSNNVVKDIIDVQNDTVLYLVDDILYLYNEKYGEVKLISNFEWKFNYKNLIFLYIP